MAKLNIRPLDDRLVVRRVEAEAKTKEGIVLPDKAKEKPKEGDVLALGTGMLLEDGKRARMQVKLKDLGLFSSDVGTEANLNGEEYLIMTEGDVPPS